MEGERTEYFSGYKKVEMRKRKWSGVKKMTCDRVKARVVYVTGSPSGARRTSATPSLGSVEADRGGVQLQANAYQSRRFSCDIAELKKKATA